MSSWYPLNVFQICCAVRGRLCAKGFPIRTLERHQSNIRYWYVPRWRQPLSGSGSIWLRSSSRPPPSLRQGATPSRALSSPIQKKRRKRGMLGGRKGWKGRAWWCTTAADIESIHSLRRESLKFCSKFNCTLSIPILRRPLALILI